MKRRVLTSLLIVVIMLMLTLVLTACGEENELLSNYKLTVQYDLNGGEWAEGDAPIADRVIAYGVGENVHFTEQQPIKAGCVFGGWDLQLKLDEAKAIVAAVWLDINVAEVTTEDGEAITAANAGLDKETGLPTVMPVKAATYIDVNENGEQDEEDTIVEYEFEGWEKSLNSKGEVIAAPRFAKKAKIIVYFDFNDGFPSTVADGSNPADLEFNDTWETQQHYYQKKVIIGTQIGYVGDNYISTVREDSALNAVANKNPIDTTNAFNKDQVSIPVRPGYEFIGWALQHEGTPVIVSTTDSYQFNINLSPSIRWERVVFYAQWQEKVPTEDVRMRFDFNDGFPSTIANGSFPTDLVANSQQYVRPGSSSAQYYYEFKPVVATVNSTTSYDINVTDDPTVGISGDFISIPARNGYVFAGWGLTPGGPAVINGVGNSYLLNYDPTAGYPTVYARWEAVKFKEPVRFDYNDGFPSTVVNGTFANDLVLNSQQYTRLGTSSLQYYYKDNVYFTTHTSPTQYDTTVTDDPTSGLDGVPIPSRDGYTFIGWSATVNGIPVIVSANSVYQLSYDPTAGTPTFYAQWKPQETRLKMAFDFNDGFPSTIVNGTNPADLTAPNYQWYYNSSTAQFYEIKVVLATYVTNQTCIANVSDDPMNAADGISIPVRAGYDFIGWGLTRNSVPVLVNANVPYAMTCSINGPLPVLYAQWKPNDSSHDDAKYIVQFIENDQVFSTAVSYHTSVTAYSPNSSDGIYFEDSYLGTANVTAPTPNPTGGAIGNISYGFHHWTLDPANNPFYDVFATNPNGPVANTLPVYATLNVGGNYVVVVRLYAVYDKKVQEYKKYIVQYIENDEIFSTVSAYHSNITFSSAFGTNPQDGIFYENGYGFSDPIIDPATVNGTHANPVGGTYNNVQYVFDHWTLDPINNPNYDIFGGSTNGPTVSTLPIVNSIIYNGDPYAIIKVFAVYRVNVIDGRKKALLFIEDCIDFDTGDGFYMADPNHPQYLNPTDGVFDLAVYAPGAIVAAPSTDPIGGTYSGDTYVFAYWTVDPTVAVPVDFFASSPHPIEDIPYINGYCRLYAVYKTESKLVISLIRDVSTHTPEDKFVITEEGTYEIRIMCNDNPSSTMPPNCGVRVFINNSQTAAAEIHSSVYCQYETAQFSVAAGDSITLSYYLPHNSNGGNFFYVDIYKVS